MVVLTPPKKSQIIRMNLQSISYANIANEVGVSKTTVFNVVKEWNKKVSDMNIDEIRFFLTEIRRSGISIQECAKGFRTYQLLREFGVKDESEEWFDNQEDENFLNSEETTQIYNKIDNTQGDGKSSDYIEKKEGNNYSKTKKERFKIYSISDFVDEIYEKCRSNEIKPSIITQWIVDLFYFFSFTDQKETIDDLTNHTSSDVKNITSSNKEIGIYSNEPSRYIPFVSHVSSFLNQKKNHLLHLEKIKKSLDDNIQVLTLKKNTVSNELSNVIRNRNRVYSYFNWYESLRKELYQKQKIVLKDNIDNMVNVINDFKNYDFDVTRIIKEYDRINSLIVQKEMITTQIDDMQNFKRRREHEIAGLEERANYYIQTINTYNELHNRGIGLKELKRLTNIIYESAYSNGFDVRDSIKKFFKDIETQYDNKLGFEKEVEELKEKKKKLEQEVPEYKHYLQSQGIVSPTLLHLHRCGVTNADIIGMNHLVIEFKNSDFLSDPFQKTIQNITDNNSKDNLSYWYLFVSKLSSLKNIYTKINERISEMDQISRQIIDLTCKKDQLNSLYLNAATNVNTLISKLYECADRVKSINEKIVPKPVIFVIFTNFGGLNPKDADKKE